MAREIFNPNFSLFVPVPLGGSTFQPNPNSVVQNDEARGTNHLDFFKFVGRVVGKALHDGQYIDAYFTRSFYKHMLGQPLTYQVCCAPRCHKPDLSPEGRMLTDAAPKALIACADHLQCKLFQHCSAPGCIEPPFGSPMGCMLIGILHRRGQRTQTVSSASCPGQLLA